MCVESGKLNLRKYIEKGPNKGQGRSHLHLGMSVQLGPFNHPPSYVSTKTSWMLKHN